MALVVLAKEGSMHQLSYVSDFARGIFWVRELALLTNLGRVSRKGPILIHLTGQDRYG